MDVNLTLIMILAAPVVVVFITLAITQLLIAIYKRVNHQSARKNHEI